MQLYNKYEEKRMHINIYKKKDIISLFILKFDIAYL